MGFLMGFFVFNLGMQIYLLSTLSDLRSDHVDTRYTLTAFIFVAFPAMFVSLGGALALHKGNKSWFQAFTIFSALYFVLFVAEAIITGRTKDDECPPGDGADFCDKALVYSIVGAIGFGIVTIVAVHLAKMEKSEETEPIANNNDTSKGAPKVPEQGNAMTMV